MTGPILSDVGPTAARFDAPSWLASFADVGGVYALASDRKLWLVVDRVEVRDLTPLMAALVGHDDRVEAIRSAIEKRQGAEVAA